MVALTADFLNGLTFLTAATVGVAEKLSNLFKAVRSRLPSLVSTLASMGIPAAPLATALIHPQRPLTTLRGQTRHATKQLGFNI